MKIQFIKNFLLKFINLILLIFFSFFAVISTKYYKNFQYDQANYLKKTINNIYFQKTFTSILDNLKPRFEHINYKIEEGDNFSKILNKIEISEKEKKKILKKISKEKKIKFLNRNEIVYFKIDRENPAKIIEFKIPISKTKTLYFVRNIKNDNFNKSEIEKKLLKIISYKESRISNSLYQSAIKQNINPSIIIDFARIYGFQIDFQRDIWKDDIFQIIYEDYINEKKEIIETGNIIFANLILQGKEHPLYFFLTKDGYDHFDETGQSIKKTLMKTPINGARLSSPYGKRKHPILGYNKMHRGTDFAAPKGTPIMAAGDGKIIHAKWCGGGGKCVKIRHNSTYSTVYAHMSKFGRGIKKGAKVKQGRVIGYVGSTGMSTGPHLHYEVIENGKKINSQKMKLPSGKILKGNERKDFEITKIKTNVLKSQLISELN